MSRPKIHLISNAHLDPVWLWEWEEGAAEALSTFRTAADLCEEFHGFVFNHNEALLYQWVEEYEPALFARIQRLVSEGGGTSWAAGICSRTATCPAANPSSGRSCSGSATSGRSSASTSDTAINFDPFGHTPRPGPDPGQVRATTPISSAGRSRPTAAPGRRLHLGRLRRLEVTGHAHPGHYNSAGGQAAKKDRAVAGSPTRPTACSLVLWGVGDHGGGPRAQDLASSTR